MKKLQKTDKYDMYSLSLRGSTWDITSDFDYTKDYDMYSKKFEMGPCTVHVCNKHDEGMHLIVCDTETGEYIGDTEVHNADLNQHIESLKNGIDTLVSAYANKKDNSVGQHPCLSGIQKSELMKAPLVDEGNADVNWPYHPKDEGEYVKTMTHKDSGHKVHVVHMVDRSEHDGYHTGSIYYITHNGQPDGKPIARTEIGHFNHETNEEYDPHFKVALTESEHRGKGLNTILHLAALKDYKNLKSDYRLSMGSQKTYEKLAQHPNVKAKLMPTDKVFQRKYGNQIANVFPQDTQHELKWKNTKKLAASEMEKGLKGDWQKEGYTLHHSKLDAKDHVGWSDLKSAVVNGQKGGVYVKQKNSEKEGVYHNLTNLDAYNKLHRMIHSGTHEMDGMSPWVYTKDHKGNVVGGVFADSGPEILNSYVHENHRRKGLATAMYDRIGKLNHYDVSPGLTQSKDAVAFWENRNKKLNKGAMRRIAPFKPQDAHWKEHELVDNWQEDAVPSDRSQLAQIGMHPNARKRALHTLSAVTPARRSKDGGREFLLHRGMGRDEYEASRHPENKRIMQHPYTDSSWTPDLQIARNFKHDYMDNEGGSGIVSAWVHENNITFIPKQYGNLVETSDGARGGENKFAPEHEIIVKQNHNSELVHKDEVARLTGRSKEPKTVVPPHNIDQQINRRGETEKKGPFTRTALTLDYAKRRSGIGKSLNKGLKLEHYSPKEGLKEISPKNVGQGVDSMSNRAYTEHPHSFYYVAGTEPEHLVTQSAKKKYTVEMPSEAKIYDLHKDPDNLHQQVLNENHGAFNRDMLIGKIKQAGYHGWQHTGSALPNVVALFHSQPTISEEDIKR